MQQCTSYFPAPRDFPAPQNHGLVSLVQSEAMRLSLGIYNNIFSPRSQAPQSAILETVPDDIILLLANEFLCLGDVAMLAITSKRFLAVLSPYLKKLSKPEFSSVKLSLLESLRPEYSYHDWYLCIFCTRYVRLEASALSGVSGRAHRCVEQQLGSSWSIRVAPRLHFPANVYQMVQRARYRGGAHNGLPLSILDQSFVLNTGAEVTTTARFDHRANLMIRISCVVDAVHLHPNSPIYPETRALIGGFTFGVVLSP